LIDQASRHQLTVSYYWWAPSIAAPFLSLVWLHRTLSCHSAIGDRAFPVTA